MSPEMGQSHVARCLEAVERIVDTAHGQWWPGFSPRELPLVLFHEDGSGYLVGRGPAGLETSPVEHAGWPVPVAELHGRFTPPPGPVPVTVGDMPLAAVSIPPADAWDETGFFFTVVRAYFRAFLARFPHWLPDIRYVGFYPDDDPVNNAFGTLEGHILYAVLFATYGTGGAGWPWPAGLLQLPPPPDANEMPRLFSLVRRERRGPIDDDLIAYEKTLEVFGGVAEYVAMRALKDLAPHEFTRSLADRLRGLLSLSAHGLGAAWQRWDLSGLALAMWLDAVSPGWQEGFLAGRRTLDDILEAGVQFDGGAGDEELIAWAEQHYGFYQALDAERGFMALIKDKNQAALQKALDPKDGKITFDLSVMFPANGWSGGHVPAVFSFDPRHAERVGEGIVIHHRGLSMEAGETTFAFTVPVVEDARSKLLHVSTGGRRLRFDGDGQVFRMVKPAAFTKGLDIAIPGIQVHAESGTIMEADGALYIKILS